MTDWNQLFQSDEFRAYRKRQAREIARVIEHSVRQVVSNGNAGHIDEIRGKTSVINAILKLPEALTGDEGVLQQLETQLAEDIGNITKYLMREALE